MKEVLIRNMFDGVEEILPTFENVINDVLQFTADALRFSLEEKEISILLCDDKEIQKLNKDFRGKDMATNVLSFETEDDKMLGDIVISIPTVLREAKEQGKEFDSHFIHLLIHGFLHLLGFDHIDENDAEEMETIEKKVMKELGLENPYE